MPIVAVINTYSEDNDYLGIENVEDVEAFLVKVKTLGGVLFPFDGGMAPFIPIDDIRAIWFDDGTGVCEGCDNCKPDGGPALVH